MSVVADAKARQEIAATLTDSEVGVNELLRRTHILVMPALPLTALQILAERLSIPPAACAAHLAILRSTLGDLASANGTLPASNPAVLEIHDIARLLDDVSEAVDPSALEEAVRSAACELVDFATSRPDARFNSGVDVTIGHVVAGLPTPRPAEVAALLSGLESNGAAMAVGPSGAGKSALIWMAAHAMRHDIRWYRVRRLRSDDVPSLVRLVKGLRATSHAPVGFVVDDLGGDERGGFDALARELREYSGALLLAACREEDLVLVRTAHEAAHVRPILDEPLAEQRWAELFAAGMTEWKGWREPYEMSGGLLLEYGHLLTRGTRLSATIEAQVDRRVLEGRGAELAVLAPVALANAFGGSVSASRLAEHLDFRAGDLKGALVRLVDEHLITERRGVLHGLHEVRSREITVAIHRVPPPALAETVAQVVALLDAAGLYPFLTRLLVGGIADRDDVIDAIASRLEARREPVVLAGALHALRVAAFRDVAAGWARIAEEEGVAPTTTGVIAFLTLIGSDGDVLPEPSRNAMMRMRAHPAADARRTLLERVVEVIDPIVAAAPDVGTAAAVLAALGEADVQLPITAGPLSALARDADLVAIRTLLEAAYGASPTLACAIADALGGEAALLHRLEREMPWVRRAGLDVDDDGSPIARADYVYVAESEQSEPHDTVVELARTLRALAPSTDSAVCRAVDARGELAGLRDRALADKHIARDALPSRAAIAWNRVRGRAAIAAVAAESHTAYLVAASALVTRTASVVQRLGQTWARGGRPSNRLVELVLDLATASAALRPAPITIETEDPFDLGDLPDSEPASFIAHIVAEQLALSLFQGSNVAPLISSLMPQVEELADRERWRLIGSGPEAAIRTLQQTLLDLHAVAAERASSDNAVRIALDREGKRGLSSAAALARRAASARMASLGSSLQARLEQDGYEAMVSRRESEPDGVRWPNEGFVVLVDIPSIFGWMPVAEQLAERCRSVLSEYLGFVVAPVRGGAVAASYAMVVFEESALPTDDLRAGPDLTLPRVKESTTDRFREGVGALVEVSGIVTTLRSGGVHADEQAALDRVASRALDAHQCFADLATENPVLHVAYEVLDDLAQRVEARSARTTTMTGASLPLPLASSMG